MVKSCEDGGSSLSLVLFGKQSRIAFHLTQKIREACIGCVVDGMG